MKALFILLVLSTGIVLVAVLAMWWRLRWHLRKPHPTLENAVDEIQPEHEPVEHG